MHLIARNRTSAIAQGRDRILVKGLIAQSCNQSQADKISSTRRTDRSGTTIAQVSRLSKRLASRCSGAHEVLGWKARAGPGTSRR
eukprot:5704613-Pleurochrysis_carterae.AAC.2